MSDDRKTTPLQERLIAALAKALPSATLTGGAALAAFYTKERATRDLDLFFHGVARLDSWCVIAAKDALAEGTERVTTLQSGPSFSRLEVTSGGESVIVDLVASPVPFIEAPVHQTLGDVSVRVDTSREILVNKVVALLSRSELRDLVDVRALVNRGGSLADAIAQAPRKDAGFSPLTLAWVLRGLPIQRLSRLTGTSNPEALEAFRDELVKRLLAEHLE